MYYFTVPMPSEKEHIDELVKINDSVNKSKITGLYFALPSNSPDRSGFEQLRTICEKGAIPFHYWEEIINYSIDKGFDFVYLLNTPKSFLAESKSLDIQLKKLDTLLSKLKKIGCNKLRVSNSQLINYLIKNYNDFDIYASTSFEYTSMKQYENFLSIFPQIKELVPSYDVNKNFLLLENLQKKFPNINIELMVNEGCLSGCPLRTHHNISIPYVKNELYSKRSYELTDAFFLKTCSEKYKKNLFEEICKSNIIYPWEIESYSKYGINRFKLVGRNCLEFNKGSYLKNYSIYLKGIDNYSNIENENFISLNHYLFDIKDFNYSIKDIRKYLPNINHFIKKGHLCSSICGVKCNYCYKCAEKIKNILK